MIGQTFSHYKIVDEIGKGGMGHVYQAEDTLLKRQVAVKFPLPGGSTYQARFLDEARAASRLQHPNIAQIFDYGHTLEGQPFLVMELISGQDLQHVLAEVGLLEPARAAEVAVGVLSALEEAHRHHLVHRDIKPPNVMITDRGVVKVLDFGLAKNVSEPMAAIAQASVTALSDTKTMGHTAPGGVVGTPRYMSPEQARGATVDARTDIFSAGLLLYECLTGQPAFSATTHAGLAELIAHSTPPRPSLLRSSVTAEFDRITMKAIEKDPARRYQTAAEMHADLQATAQVPAARSRSDVALSGARAWVSRYPFRFGAVALSLLLMAALRTVLFPAHRPPPDAIRWYKEGLSALRDGTHYRASKALERAVTLDAKFALAHARLAEAWSKLEYTGKAKDEMLRAHAASESHWFAYAESRLMDAISRALIRDFPSAIERYTEIANRAPNDEKAQAQVDLGRAYEDSEQIPQALDHYREALRLDPEYATASLRSGIQYGKLQKLDEAENGFARAELLYQAASDLEGQTEVLFQRGYLASKTRRLPQARAQFEKALSMARATGNEFRQIAIILELSTVAHNEGNMPEAEQRAKEGIDQARRGGIGFLENRGLVNLGNAYLVSSNLPLAEACYREAWEAARRASMARLEARAAFSLGSLHLQQSKARQALTELEASRAFFGPGGYLVETRQIDLLTARVHRSLGELDLALAAFDRTFKLSEASKDLPMMSLAQEGRAGVFADQESLPEAIQAYEKTMALGNTLHDSTRVFFASVNRGKALWRLGRYEEAAQSFAEAEALARASGGLKNRLWLVAADRAEMADSQGRAEAAVALGREALRLAGAEPVRLAMVKSVLGLALVHTGRVAEGKALAEEGLSLSPRDDTGLVAAARIRFAEAQLASGDSPGAQATLGQALQDLAAHPQPISVMRALALAATAARRAGDLKGEAAFGPTANAILVSLKSSLGPRAFTTLSARPDMRESVAFAEKFH